MAQLTLSSGKTGPRKTFFLVFQNQNVFAVQPLFLRVGKGMIAVPLPELQTMA